MAEASPLTLTAYAARRGCSKTAVSRAIKGGRLSGSVVRDEHGRPAIRDADLADREWLAATDLSRAPGYVKERAAARDAKVPPADMPPAMTPAPGESGPVYLGMSLADASAAEKVYRAQLAELDLLERRGALVDAEEMQASLADVFTRCRTRLLGLPTRAKQQLPHLTVTDIGTLDGLVREALEALSLDVGNEAADG